MPAPHHPDRLVLRDRLHHEARGIAEHANRQMQRAAVEFVGEVQFGDGAQFETERVGMVAEMLDTAGAWQRAAQSLNAITKRMSLRAGSKSGGPKAASMRRSASRSSGSIAAARGVGAIRVGVRRNRGSPQRSRSRFSAWLTADWLKPSVSPARVVLPVSEHREEDADEVEIDLVVTGHGPGRELRFR